MPTLEKIILDIYHNQPIQKYTVDDIGITEYMTSLLNKYDLNIYDQDVRESMLNQLKYHKLMIWTKPYIRRVIYDFVYQLKDTFENEFMATGEYISLRDLYFDFKNDKPRYDFIIDDICRSKYLVRAFHQNNYRLTPKHLKVLVDMLYTNIKGFEQNKVIQDYLLLTSMHKETKQHMIVKYDSNKKNMFYESNVYNVIMSKKDLQKQNYEKQLNIVKQIRLVYPMTNYQTEEFNNTYVNDKQHQITDTNTVNDGVFYFTELHPTYGSDTEREYQKDQRAAPLLYEIQTLCNKHPKPYRHILYLMYGSDSNIIKIGRTMNGTERVGLYQAPISQNDSYFYNDEIVMLLGFDYSYGTYKKYNNYKNGLTPGTAKFFAAEYMLKQMLYNYCEMSPHLEKFEKGNEWFQFKVGVSNKDKAQIVHLIRQMIIKANDVVETALDDCENVAEVKKEIGYNGFEDVKQWVSEVLNYVGKE